MSQRLVKTNNAVEDNEVYGRVKLYRTPDRMPSRPFREKLKRKSVTGDQRKSFLNLGKVKRE